MKIGISTASLYPLETEKSLEILCQNEIPVTEIFFNSPCELEMPFVKKLQFLSKTYGVEVASVHPCGSVAEPYFLFSGYERRYKESLDWYKKYYEAAAVLGAKYVVLHGDSLIGHVSDREYCLRLMEMNSQAQDFGVTVTHENVNRYRCATPENVKNFTRLTEDKLKFTFDIKQAIRAGYSPYEMYDAMKGNVVNVHISDHTPQFDCMLPGKGEFDFTEFFNRLVADGYKGACLIEVYNQSYNDISELIEAYKFVTKFHKIC